MALSAPGRVRQRPLGVIGSAEREAFIAQEAPIAPTPRTPSSTIRHLRVAFKDTPPHLKDLEEGWRLARRGVLGGDVRVQGAPAVRPTTCDPRRVRYAEDTKQPTPSTSLLPTPPPSPKLGCSPSEVDVNPSRPGPKLPKTHHHLTGQAPPSPILSHPLPPMKARKLGPTATITVHDMSCPYSLTITLGEPIRVSRTGEGILVRSRHLRLSSSASWTEQEHKLWATVAQLVDELKRRTTRVKVFSPLGRLTVSCATSPDIVLSFSSGPTRVRLTYSLSRLTARVDTATRSEGYTTRRVVPLRWEAAMDTPLGLRTDGWGELEKTAVSSLWALRGEWARFVPGFTSGSCCT